VFHALGRPADEGRAQWVVAIARSDQGRAAESAKAAGAALALCRRAGDLYGAGNALNLLIFNEPDFATRLKLLNQALADFEAAGYVERQGSSPATRRCLQPRPVPARPPSVAQGHWHPSRHWCACKPGYQSGRAGRGKLAMDASTTPAITLPKWPE
jgi:hypothetical protein